MKEETTFDKLFIKLDKIIQLQEKILKKLENNNNLIDFPVLWKTDCVGKDLDLKIKFEDGINDLIINTI